MEKWIDIENLDGNYQISNLGRVRNTKTEKILKCRELNKERYRKITITYKGKIFTYQIHRLVLSHFEPNVNAKFLQVHHIDLNRTNNNLDNLKWLSFEDNIKLKIQNTNSYKHFIELFFKYGDEKLENILKSI